MTDIWAAVPTPFAPDGSLALEVVDRQRRHLEAGGVDGAFVSGTTGEFASLDVAERLALMDAWAEAGGTLRRAAHVGSTVAADAQRLAAHAAGLGFEMVAAVAPFSGAPPHLRGVVDHLADTAAAAGDLPFCYYHIPAFTGLPYGIERLLDALGERIGTLSAVKFTSPDLVTFARLRDTRPDLRVYLGQDELMPAALALGAQELIGSLYNAVGAAARRTADAFAAGDAPRARREHAVVREVAAAAGRHGGLAFIKALAGLVGPDAGPARAPWGPLAVEDHAVAVALAGRIRAAGDGGQPG